MLADPITITVNGNAKALPRINQDQQSAEYLLEEATQSWYLKISHKKDKPKANGVVMRRHVVDFTQTIYATGSTLEKVRRCYITYVMEAGDTADEVFLVTGLNAWLSASTYAQTVKVLGGES